MAQGFDVAPRPTRRRPTSPERSYDLKVNHPLTIGDTEVFLIGHGYAPVITIRDGNGDVAYSGPTVFLPTDQTFRSFGVVKAPDAEPSQIGLEGEFYPTYAFIEETGPFSAFGNAGTRRSRCSSTPATSAWTTAAPQSVYALDKAERRAGEEGRRDDVPARPAARADRRAARRRSARSASTGSSAGTRSRSAARPASASPSRGVVLALVGLLGSLFIRPRRVWVRARREGDGTLVEVAGARPVRRRRRLRRAGRGRGRPRRAAAATGTRRRSVTDAAWETLSNQAVAVCGVVYFLALLAHLVEWARCARCRSPPTPPSRPARRRPVAVRRGRHRRRRRRRGRGAAYRHVRPARPAAHLPRRRGPLRGAGRPGHGRGPEPGAVGQHVRVHADRHVRGGRALPRALPQVLAGLDGADRPGVRARRC